MFSIIYNARDQINRIINTYSIKQNPPGPDVFLSIPILIVFIFPAFEKSLWTADWVVFRFKFPTYNVVDFSSFFL